MNRNTIISFVVGLLVTVLVKNVPADTVFDNFHIVRDNSTCCGQFGIGVSLQGDTAMVGAAGLNIGGNSGAGAAFVLHKTGGVSWSETARILDPIPATGDGFGKSVSLSGDLALIGAHFDTNTDTGKAFVFQNDGLGDWSHVATLISDSAAPDARFGTSVALLGKRALVGASDDDAAGPNFGAAYIFEQDSFGNWTQVARLIGDDSAFNDQFGASVSLFNDYAVVGAPYHDRDGAAYLFREVGSGNWQQVAKLVASDRTAFDAFGHSVSIWGRSALVGAAYADDSDSANGFPAGHGAAYLFEQDVDGNWIQVGKLVGDDLNDQSHFGFSASLQGNFALVGGSGNIDGSGGGAAYLFRRSDLGSWSQVSKLLPRSGAPNTFFGRSVSLSDSRALVGGYNAAFFYDVIPEPATWSLGGLAIASGVIGQRRRCRALR